MKYYMITLQTVASKNNKRLTIDRTFYYYCHDEFDLDDFSSTIKTNMESLDKELNVMALNITFMRSVSEKEYRINQ